MKKQINQVKEFHETFGVPVEQVPHIPHRARWALRYHLLREEVDELLDGCEDMDTVAVADAITDILYVTFGAALEFGLGDKLETLFDEVHRSNMSKADADGNPIYNDEGKVLKGPNYSPPDIGKILNNKASAQDM